MYRVLGTIMPKYVTGEHGTLQEDSGVILPEAGTVSHNGRFIRGLSAKGLKVGDTKVFIINKRHVDGVIFYDIAARNPLDVEILQSVKIFGEAKILDDDGETTDIKDYVPEEETQE